MQFGQFGEAADAFTVDHDLWHRASTIGDFNEFPAGSLVDIDADLLERDLPLSQQHLRLVTKRADPCAVDFHSGHR